MVGNGHIELVMAVVYLVNEAAEHGRRKEHLAGEVNAGGDNEEFRKNQISATEKRKPVKSSRSHAAKAAEWLI